MLRHIQGIEGTFMEFVSSSCEETKKIAYDMAKTSKPSNIYSLVGDLGAGKTVFSKGFAEGLGIDEEITSPTFTIINVYDGSGRLPFYHFDVYRIEDPSAMEDTGYEEYFYGKGICIIEWAEKIKDLMPENAIWVFIEKDYEKHDNFRRIKVKKSEKE